MSARTETFPSQIKYIVGNEAAERFSYYGMRSILVIFMTQHLLLSEADAKTNYHLFISACYLLPLLGAYLSDRFWGKYKTIMLLSIIYCAGHAVLAIWESKTGLYWGLGLIAIGAGGIKPCVSAHVGDQFTESNKGLVNKVFGLFYWSVNFGAFFSQILVPWVLPKYGASVAFGIPGVLMAIATFVFWMGRDQYITIAPTGKDGPAGFMPILFYSLKNLKKRQKGQSFLDVARERYPEEAVEAAKAAASVFNVFITVSIFWALYDQQGSSWVLQAEKMNREVLGFHIESSQIGALNPILVLLLIPVFSYGIYPAIEKLGVAMTPLRKMAIGMFMAALSFVAIGMLQAIVDSGQTISVAWQFIPYLIITASEIMVSITGLEFAYTQAPRSMKSTIMSFWLLTVFAGNILAAYVAKLNTFTGTGEFFFYAGLTAVVSVFFVLSAMKYKTRNYVEKDESAGVLQPSVSGA